MKGYLTFSEALRFMKNGLACARKGWNGKGMWVTATSPTFVMKDPRWVFTRTHRCLVMKTVDDRLTSWTPCDLDLFADDWYIVEEDACP